MSTQAILGKLDELLARPPLPRFLTIKQSATYAGLSCDSIRRLIERGDLVGLRPLPGRILLDRKQIDSFLLGWAKRPTCGRGRATGGGGGR